MPILRGRLHHHAGPIVPVALRQAETAEEVTAFEALGYAVIDTGAEYSGIDEDLAIRLKLPTRGALTLRRAGPEAEFRASRFSGEVAFPGSNFASLRTDLVGYRHLDTRHDDGVRVIALIGRDFLRTVTLIWTGPRGDLELRR